jgi:S1-C subfamily serine protease
MKRWSRLLGVLALMATTGTGASLVGERRAEAQPLQYCRDLGVLVQSMDGGLWVRAMRGGATARMLGIRPGDLIFAVNGTHPDSLNDLHRVLFTGGDNEDHDLDVLRGGRHLHALVFHVNGEILVHQSLR